MNDQTPLFNLNWSESKRPIVQLVRMQMNEREKQYQHQLDYKCCCAKLHTDRMKLFYTLANIQACTLISAILMLYTFNYTTHDTFLYAWFFCDRRCCRRRRRRHHHSHCGCYFFQFYAFCALPAELSKMFMYWFCSDFYIFAFASFVTFSMKRFSIYLFIYFCLFWFVSVQTFIGE